MTASTSTTLWLALPRVGEEIEDHRPIYGFDDPDQPPFNDPDRIPNIYEASLRGFDEDEDSEAITQGAYEVELRIASAGESPFSQLDRITPSTGITAPAGTQVFDGKQFSISDGNYIFTFEYNDLGINEPGDVSTGTTAIDYNVTDADYVIATTIRDAINSLAESGAINLTATSANGAAEGAPSTRSARVNLFGTPTVFEGDGANGIDFISTNIEAASNRRT